MFLAIFLGTQNFRQIMFPAKKSTKIIYGNFFPLVFPATKCGQPFFSRPPPPKTKTNKQTSFGPKMFCPNFLLA